MRYPSSLSQYLTQPAQKQYDHKLEEQNLSLEEWKCKKAILVHLTAMSKVGFQAVTFAI